MTNRIFGPRLPATTTTVPAEPAPAARGQAGVAHDRIREPWRRTGAGNPQQEEVPMIPHTSMAAAEIASRRAQRAVTRHTREMLRAFATRASALDPERRFAGR